MQLIDRAPGEEDGSGANSKSLGGKTLARQPASRGNEIVL